jgi:hypothetical protein
VISISNNKGSVLKKLISILSIFFVISAVASVPGQCDLDHDETVNIAKSFFQKNQNELLDWADDELLPLLLDNIDRDGFYHEDQNKFYFPLFTIREEYIRGSLWIEVTCAGQASYGQYFEEI